MSTNVITSTDAPSEQAASVTNMDTAVSKAESSVPQPTTTTKTTEEAAMVNDSEEETSKGGKRKRSTKKSVEIEETSISNGRPRRTLTKREDPPPASVVNGNNRTTKATAQRQSVEQSADDDDDEREKNLPVVHDVADVAWVKMGGHPWWPSLIVRDPNDSTSCFTKVIGSSRAKRVYFVSFYGSTADFAWVPDSAIIPYQGVEAFTKYAQESVDKAVTKGQKEHLTERFQLKVTISRREEWESAVKEADLALTQTSEKRLEDIEPKIQYYTNKTAPSIGRKSKAKREESPPANASASAIEEEQEEEEVVVESSEEDNDDEDDEDAMPVKKTPSVKIKFNASNDSNTPSTKRRYVRKSTGTNEGTTVFGQTANGSSVSYEKSNGKENGSPKKRGRPRLSKPSVATSNGETNSTLKKPIVKPQAFTNKVNPASLNNILVGQHHRFDTRVGFLSPFEEQEIFDIVDQLNKNKTFDEAEQLAKRRFEQILCANLNKTQVDIPHEWFYSFLFAHPILIVKNTHWFNEKKSSEPLNDPEMVNDINRTSLTPSVQVLKHQLQILSKLYQNQLQIRSTNTNEDNA